MRYLIILIFLTSCGSGSNNSYKESDPYFNQLKESYILLIDSYLELTESYKFRINNIPITFGELEEGKAGVCRGNKEIIIDNKYKDTIYIEFIVYHELNHCIFNLIHSTDPSSIMYTEANINYSYSFIDDIKESLK